MKHDFWQVPLGPVQNRPTAQSQSLSHVSPSVFPVDGKQSRVLQSHATHVVDGGQMLAAGRLR